MTESIKGQEIQPSTQEMLTEARASISQLCKGERWQMCIPANHRDDHDLIMSDALLALESDLLAALRENESLKASLHSLRWIDAGQHEWLGVEEVNDWMVATCSCGWTYQHPNFGTTQDSFVNHWADHIRNVERILPPTAEQTAREVK